MISSERTLKLEELIEKYDHLKKDLKPVEEKLNAELSRIRLQVLDRARARTSFTGDPLKDLSIFKFGKEFSENYAQLLNLKNILKNAEGQFILIHDTSFNLLVNELNETDRCYIPFRVAALGVIDSNPLETGYEYDTAGDKYYFKLRFKDGSYIRELEIRDQGKADKWLSMLPSFRGRKESYTEKTEKLKLVQQTKDYQSSDDYIRHIYAEGEWETKPKKPYWRIAPDMFDVSKSQISSAHAIEIFEEQEFPSKDYKSFALYIGNEEVTKKLKLDLKDLNTLEKIYNMLDGAQEDGWKSLIF
ncbi:MAG: hypothetical protein ABFR82_02085 [Nitrospirota bacterium]